MLGTPNGVRQTARRSQRREETRGEILDAAWQVARSAGLSQLTLREVADRVGMRAPSLYSHFDSKLAIFDAMFGQAWGAYEQAVRPELDALPADARGAAHLIARRFFDFATAEPARHELMSHRSIPGFEPSPENYAPAVRMLELGYAVMAERGLTDRDDFTILIAMVGGLVDQQLSNDPGGDRFGRLLTKAVDIWADGVGLPRIPGRGRGK